ncbi:hypothetical protein P5V15_015900 [Pogonomyrmex californicus]
MWKKSTFIYKSEVQCISLRHSTTTSNVAKIAVFSRDGDSGLTITDAGDTKPKDDMIFNALGATDELSSYILKRVQMILFDLSHAISKSVPGKTKLFESKHTKDLEKWILEHANQLLLPEDYIIPQINVDTYFCLFLQKFNEIFFTVLRIVSELHLKLKYIIRRY